ncbi:MAG: site-specific integrase [Isosphaeraceae bacterium]
MPTKRTRVPSYRHHRARNLAVVTLAGKDFYLGRYDSPESHAEYRRLIAEYLAHGHVRPNEPDPLTPTICELIEPYLDHCERYYVKNGRATSQVAIIKLALRVLREHYGHTPADEFGPLALQAVRNQYVEQGLSRSEVNRRVSLVKQFFAWATANEMIPPKVFQALQAVRGLRKGRTEAYETERVRPVPDAWVKAVLSHVAPQVAVMIELQRLTGMRPNKVVALRTRDLSTTGAVWEYTPSSHKTEHHGKSRTIMLGPRAQGLLRPWLRTNLDEYLFRPDEAERARVEALRASRKSKVWPSNSKVQAAKRQARKRRKLGERYTVSTYRQAIHRGSRRAGTGPWNPNQIRHLAATRLRRELGDVDAVRSILGHSDVDTTTIYAERDREAAREAMLKLG